MKYWDSCAIIPLCFKEPFSESVRFMAKEDEDLVVWWGTSVECCSAFARLRRENKISMDEERTLRGRLNMLAETWDEISASDEVRILACRLLLKHQLRAADSLQLAAAVIWTGKSPEGFDFVCLDKRLREAAQAEGFTVLPAQLAFDALCS
jgi:predicted nucleic acid-binding protein